MPWNSLKTKIAPTLILVLLLVSSCKSPQIGADISVTITADNQTSQISLAPGSTVAQALQSAGIATNKLDRTTPPSYATLNDLDTIIVTRVEEVFETEQRVVAFEKQVVRNETLPEGETRIVQTGVNGLEEITYRRILEDKLETSKSIVKTVTLQETTPEILMVGVQAAFTPINIPGVMAYLSNGNAWIMEGSTANRRVIVSTGDLDGRIFSLSPNGEYLIFTRKSQKPADEEINTLWAVRTKNIEPKPVFLQAKNIVHFAAWIPGTNSVAYSTVEPRSAIPGWQANNDLYRVSITGGSPLKLLDANSGGVYGWWGMSFAFAPDGRLAYSRPDEIGLVDQDGGYLKPLLEIVPLNTRSDWSWIPPLAWGADNTSLYFISHAPAPAPINAEESPYFNLSATSFETKTTVDLADSTGMFAYPAASKPASTSADKEYKIAYLQAVFVEQSDTSRYRLFVMDRDGSNKRGIFPPVDSSGLEPQVPAWAPGEIEGQGDDFISVVYQGNIWLIDSGSGMAYQATGDGSIGRVDWQ